MTIGQIVNLVFKENEPSWRVPDKRWSMPSIDDDDARLSKRSRGSESAGKASRRAMNLKAREARSSRL